MVLPKCPWSRLRTDCCLCVQVVERVAASLTMTASRRAPSSWMCSLLPAIGCGLTGIKAGGLGYSFSGGLQEVTLLCPLFTGWYGVFMGVQAPVKGRTREMTLLGVGGGRQGGGGAPWIYP